MPLISTQDASDSEFTTFDDIHGRFRAVRDYYDEWKRDRRKLELTRKVTYDYLVLRFSG